jgi:hypothetical protein
MSGTGRPRLERRRWRRWGVRAMRSGVRVLRDRLRRACLWGTMICAVQGAIRVSNGQIRAVRWGRGAMSCNGSSENQR